MMQQPNAMVSHMDGVSKALDCSPSTVRRLMAGDPDFPKPFRLTPKGDLLWELTDIRAYIERKKSQARAA